MSEQFSTQITQLKAGATFWQVLHDLAQSGEVGLRIVKTAALDFAERALPHYEAKHPGDLRPRTAIEVARRYLRGEATIEELKAAEAAAQAAADAAYADAAYAAADAAYADAWATYAAAKAAVWAAEAAAGYVAATAAAWAAQAAADAAAGGAEAAEHDWQRDHLIELLKSGEQEKRKVT